MISKVITFQPICSQTQSLNFQEESNMSLCQLHFHLKMNHLMEEQSSTKPLKEQQPLWMIILMTIPAFTWSQTDSRPSPRIPSTHSRGQRIKLSRIASSVQDATSSKRRKTGHYQEVLKIFARELEPQLWHQQPTGSGRTSWKMPNLMLQPSESQSGIDHSSHQNSVSIYIFHINLWLFFIIHRMSHTLKQAINNDSMA